MIIKLQIHSVRPWQNSPAQCNVTLQLFGPIQSYEEKLASRKRSSLFRLQFLRFLLWAKIDLKRSSLFRPRGIIFLILTPTILFKKYFHMKIFNWHEQSRQSKTLYLNTITDYYIFDSGTNQTVLIALIATIIKKMASLKHSRFSQQRQYSKHLIFFTTYEQAQYARVLHYTQAWKGVTGTNTLAYQIHS